MSQHTTGPRAVFRCDREVSSLFPYFAMIRRQHFLDLGGLDKSLDPLWAWVDFCMKVNQEGLRIISTPQVHVHHFDDAPEVVPIKDAKISIPHHFRTRWQKSLTEDIFSVFRSEQIVQRSAKWKQ
jgi:GT2 family glycosyltransferase